MANIDRDKLYDGLLGLAIGDALGVPAEFMSRKHLNRKPITDMINGGCWDQPAGTWSDDTSMTLATIDALNKNDWIINKDTLIDIMINFVKWERHGKFAAHENRFDIGNTCLEAIDNFSVNKNPYTCGVTGDKRCGNGALMRILPCIYIDSDMDILSISRLTHDNETCDLASLAYIAYAKELVNGKDKYEALGVIKEIIDKNPAYNKTLYKLFNNVSENEIYSTGYVVDTFEAAIWCVLNTDNYKDCVLKAVNLGDDTDTVAAIAGGLAGLYYGKDKIPTEWVSTLRDIGTLKRICFNE